VNALPEHRRMLAGRTWAQSYSRSHYAPLSGPWRRHERMADVLLAVALGVVVDLSLLHWWAA